MSSDSRSVSFEGIVEWIPIHPRWWFSFIERVILTGVLQGLAWPFHCWPLFGLWLVSVVFLIAHIVRAMVLGLSAGIDSLPWAQIETLPRVIAYPVAVVIGVLSLGLLILGQYTVGQLAGVVEVVAKSHMALH